MKNHSAFESTDPSRRELLKGLAAGAAALLPAGALLAQKKRGRIDVHHHMLPPFQENMTARQYTPQASLDAMDKFGTEQAILSLTVAAEYLYDGSEKGVKVYETTTVIGPPLESAANAQLPPVKNSEVLDKIQSWPVVVSYYDQNPKKDGLPSYEVSFRMYANGVSRKLKLDYGTFSLNGELTSIEFLPMKPCQ